MDCQIITSRNPWRLLITTLALILLYTVAPAAHADAEEDCKADGGGWWVNASGVGTCFKKLPADVCTLELMDEVDDTCIDFPEDSTIAPDPSAGTIGISDGSLYGSPVLFHDGTIYTDPGTYTDDGYMFDVGSGQYAISIFADWNGFSDIHVLSIVNILNGGNSIVSVDSDGDGILGHQINNGPFLGKNFYISAASPVPIPAAACLFGSGLLGLIGMSRRKAI